MVIAMEPSKKRQDLIKVAKLYYFGDMSQNEIAELLEISRPKVSRMLTEARQLNIVQVVINDPSSPIARCEQKLRDHFGLKYAYVVPTHSSEAATKSAIGQVASAFLNEHLQENSNIGISWGTTLAAFVNEFQAKRHMPNVTVVQLVGGTYNEFLNIDVRELVKKLAMVLDCKHSILQAPLIVHNPKLKEMLMEEPATKDHFKKIHDLDIALIGIGSAYYKDSIVFRANYIEETSGKLLNDMGLVCDICGHQLMPDGTAPHTFLTDRVVGITLKELRRVPLVVGLCEGKKKMIPLLAALRGGFLNCIVIDEVAALTLIAEEHL